MHIGNTQSSSSVSAQRGVWFINSLFVPDHELAPNILRVVFFAALVSLLSLIIFVHACAFSLPHITFSDIYLVTFALLVELILSKVSFGVSIHHKNITESWHCDYL